MANFKNSHHFDVNDEYMTRKSAWEDIFPYIPDRFKNGKAKIWEPFKGNGQSGTYLKELGFDVYMKDENFFNVSKDKLSKKNIELIITNMPFSIKADVFEKLKLLDIPFICLVPTTTIHTKYFKETFDKKNKFIQLIIPYKKRQYDKMGLAPGEKQNDNCSFYSLYVCYKVKLKNDVIFI